VGVEAQGIEVMALRLERMPLEVRKRLKVVVKAGAVSVAAQAKTNAAYSSRIPGAVRVRSKLGTELTGVGATVVVSAAKAPDARVLELGNTDSASTATFRHPVFGRDVWVSQPMRPFLFPALESKHKGIVESIYAAIESAQAGL
jgi:hypothetical protein